MLGTPMQQLISMIVGFLVVVWCKINFLFVMALPIIYAICFHMQGLFLVHDKIIFVTLGCSYVLICVGDKTQNTILWDFWLWYGVKSNILSFIALPINYTIGFHIQVLFLVLDQIKFVTLGCSYDLITIGDKTPNTILHEWWKLGCSLAKHWFFLVSHTP